MIKIGIPSKGRLRKDTLNIFKNKKLKILSERGDRDLFGYIKGNKNKVLIKASKPGDKVKLKINELLNS